MRLGFKSKQFKVWPSLCLQESGKNALLQCAAGGYGFVANFDQNCLFGDSIQISKFLYPKNCQLHREPQYKEYFRPCPAKTSTTKLSDLDSTTEHKGEGKIHSIKCHNKRKSKSESVAGAPAVKFLLGFT